MYISEQLSTNNNLMYRKALKDLSNIQLNPWQSVQNDQQYEQHDTTANNNRTVDLFHILNDNLQRYQNKYKNHKASNQNNLRDRRSSVMERRKADKIVNYNYKDTINNPMNDYYRNKANNNNYGHKYRKSQSIELPSIGVRQDRFYHTENQQQQGNDGLGKQKDTYSKELADSEIFQVRSKYYKLKTISFQMQKRKNSKMKIRKKSEKENQDNIEQKINKNEVNHNKNQKQFHEKKRDSFTDENIIMTKRNLEQIKDLNKTKNDLKGKQNLQKTKHIYSQIFNQIKQKTLSSSTKEIKQLKEINQTKKAKLSNEKDLKILYEDKQTKILRQKSLKKQDKDVKNINNNTNKSSNTQLETIKQIKQMRTIKNGRKHLQKDDIRLLFKKRQNSNNFKNITQKQLQKRNSQSVECLQEMNFSLAREHIYQRKYNINIHENTIEQAIQRRSPEYLNRLSQQSIKEFKENKCISTTLGCKKEENNNKFLMSMIKQILRSKRNKQVQSNDLSYHFQKSEENHKQNLVQGKSVQFSPFQILKQSERESANDSLINNLEFNDPNIYCQIREKRQSN